MARGIFLFLLLVGCSGNPSSEPEEIPPDQPAPLTWGLVSSTIQLVKETVDPKVCQSGWTRLREDMELDGEENVPPLQKDYVSRFTDISELGTAAVSAKSVIGSQIPVLRISTVWPCWDTNEPWPGYVDQLIMQLQDAGWKVEISLLQKDSYPAALHGSGNFGLGGWANPKSSQQFALYTQSVLQTIGSTLPAGTRIYLSNEPVSSLFDGYLHRQGKWPPGGKTAGKSLGKALINIRKAFRTAALLISQEDFTPAIAVNIRPIELRDDSAPAATLSYVRNWWLLDGLLKGCNNEDFSINCESVRGAVIQDVGVTYYGIMSAADQTVEIADGVEMAMPVQDYAPDPYWFDQALKQLKNNYDVPIGAAEIGFSSGSIDKMEDWLREYLTRIKIHTNGQESTFVQLHTLFESAEFSPGEWYFHMIEGCNGTPCRLTPWGKRVLEIIAEN